MTKLDDLDLITKQNGYVDCISYIYESGSEFDTGWSKIIGKIARKEGIKLADCNSCRFLKYNECFFDNEEIIEIKKYNYQFEWIRSVFFPKYRCEICGNSISNFFNVLKKLYIKKKENMNIPLICNSCYRHILKYGNIRKKFLFNFFIYFTVFIFLVSTLVYSIFGIINNPLQLWETSSFFIILSIIPLYFVIRKLGRILPGKRRINQYLSNRITRIFIIN